MEIVEILSDDEDVMFVKENKREFVDLTQKIECTICLDLVEASNMHQLKSCKHTFCSECLSQHIKVCIDNNNDIKCPKCKMDVLFHDIKFLVSKKDVEKFEAFSLKKYLESSKEFFQCKGPNCNNGVLKWGNSAKWNCDMCKKSWCLACGEESHSNSCAQYQNWKIENQQVESKLNDMIVAGLIKKCPGCKVNTQKNMG